MTLSVELQPISMEQCVTQELSYQKVINNMLGENGKYEIPKGIPHHAHALRNEGFHDKYE